MARLATTMDSTPGASIELPDLSTTPDSQTNTQLSNEGLRREADGLLAGISFLNQTEEIEENIAGEDEDEDDGCEDEDEDEDIKGGRSTRCFMVQESERTNPDFVLEPSTHEDQLISMGAQSSLVSAKKCLSSCWENNLCKASQLQMTSNCPVHLLCHWIELHAETNVISDDGFSPVWLCPVPSCGASFYSRPNLRRHVQRCGKIDTLTGLYWCNAHNNFEGEVFYKTCESLWHQKTSEHKSLEEFKVLTYKFNRTWPNTDKFQPDPQSCRHCKASTPPRSYTREHAIDHMLGYHGPLGISQKLSALECVDEATLSKMRDLGRSDPALAGVLDQIETRYLEHLIIKFSSFLESRDIFDKGIACICLNDWYFVVSSSSFSKLDVSKSRWDNLHDITHTLQHFCYYHSSRYLRKATDNQQRLILADPRIQNKYRCLKHRQEMLRIIKQLQEEVQGTRTSCHYLLTTAGVINEIRIRLINDVGTLLKSLDSRLHQDPSTPPPRNIYEDLQRVESLLDELFASPELMETQNSNGEIKDSVNLNEERRKLRAMLGRMSQLDKSDQTQPQDKQWANLRSLRASSSIFHAQILSATNREGRRKFGFRQRFLIRKFRQQIKSSSDFLITGILTFRKVLQGSIPATLAEVLAFVSLSHVMSDELWCKGKISEPLNFNSGFPAWKRAIRSKAEQDAFQELVICLWPESSLAFPPEEDKFTENVQTETPLFPKETFEDFLAPDIVQTLDALEEEQLNFDFTFPTSASGLELPYLGASGFDLPAWDDISTGMFNPVSSLANGTEMMVDTLSSFQEPVQYLLEQSHGSDEFRFSDFLDLRYWENSPGQPLDATLSTIIPETNPEVEMIEPDLEAEPPELVQLTVSIEPSSESCQPEQVEGDSSTPIVEMVNDTPSEVGLLAIICNTAIFQIVLSYMNYICGLGDLLTFFAGNLKTRRESTGGASSQGSARDKEITTLVKVFYPLLAHHELEELKHVVGVTSIMLQYGFFACLRDIEDYLVHLGRHFALSKRSYMLLISKSLKYLRTAALESSTPAHSCTCDTIHDLYTVKDIKAREAEQLKWAAQKFDGLHCHASPKEGTSSSVDQVVAFEESPSSMSPFRSFLASESTTTSDLSKEASTSTAPLRITPQSEAGIIAGPRQCDLCANAGISKSFNGPDAECNLRRHIREKHEGKKFPCPNCQAPFSRLHNLRTHYKRKHKGADMPSSLGNSRSRDHNAEYRVSPY